jgi:hypothetical protein
VCDYVHLNPPRAKLLRGEQPLSDYPWSIDQEFLRASVKRPGRLRVDHLLGELWMGRDDSAGLRRFAEAMEERRGPGRTWGMGGCAMAGFWAQPS